MSFILDILETKTILNSFIVAHFIPKCRRKHRSIFALLHELKPGVQHLTRAAETRGEGEIAGRHAG